MTNAADTTPPPSDPKAPKGKAEPKGPTGPVLVMIHRDGIYQASRHEQVVPPKGSGAKDPQQRIHTFTLRLMPGLNLVDREAWTKVWENGAHTGLRARINRQSLEVIGGGGTTEWPIGWSKVANPTKIAHVRGTTQVPTLEEMLEVEEREEVAQAIRETLAAIRGESQMGRIARAAQRQQHRRGARL